VTNASTEYHADSTPSPLILVVDDMPDARVLLAKVLRSRGYHAVTAEDGNEAIAAIEAERPDLVLLDLTMPVMDGLAVLRRLRSDSKWRNLPVILFSALAEGPMIEEARRMGVQDHVVKGSTGVAGLIARIDRQLAHA
jgi:putative two-component system response regulator